jgi:hypothetical protein
MPEADGVTVGGAPDLTKRVSFYDIPSAMEFDVVSSSASDASGPTVQICGRDSTGVIQYPAAITLTGTTLIANSFGGQSFQRLIAGMTSGVTSSTHAFGTFTGTQVTALIGTAPVGDVAVIGHTRVLSGNHAQGSTQTSGTTPPTMTLKSGDGSTIGALTYSGLGLIILITGGTGAHQLRMISVPYASGAYGTDVVAVNRDWDTPLDSTSVYSIGYGMLFDILPNPVTAITRIFATSQADVPGGSQRVFYEKINWINTNSSTALVNAAMEVLSESGTLPSGALLDLALTKALDDTQTSANRQTLPTNGDSSALVFVTQPSSISVIASPGSLPNGNSASVAQGGWLRLTLPAGTTVYEGTADLRVTGATT